MHLDATALTPFARGCAVLGSGGGGPAALTRALAEQAITECGPVRVLDAAELPEDALVMPVALTGSPAVAAERIGGRAEPERLRERVERSRGAQVAAVMSGEIGGLNGCLAVAFAARCGLPLLDADSMGRAFPRMDQNVLELAGLRPGPAVLADEYGRTVVLDHIDGRHLELLARSVVDAFGGRAASSDYPLTAGQAARHAVTGSVRRALALGRGELPEPMAAGKVTAVRRHGADATTVLVEAGPRMLRVEARSEFIAVVEDGRLLAQVPDIIALVDARDDEPLLVDAVRYGLHVRIHTLRAAPVWYTPQGLALAGAPSSAGHPVAPGPQHPESVEGAHRADRAAEPGRHAVPGDHRTAGEQAS